MNRIEFGDCREIMRRWAAAGVRAQTCVTSPPYFGLRSYLPAAHGDKALEIGLEQTPEEYIASMVDVFRCVRDVLAEDGTLWINIGDSYAGSGRGGYPGGSSTLAGTVQGQDNSRLAREASMVSMAQRINCPANRNRMHAGMHESQRAAGAIGRAWVPAPDGLKNKDLIGIPWMLSFALRAGFATCSGCGVERRGDLWPKHNGHRVCIDCLMDWRHDAKVVQSETGWYLRQEIIWAKATSGATREGRAMPESVRDRCAKSHETIFLLAKSPRYRFDADAIKEPAQNWGKARDRTAMRGGTTDPKLKHGGLSNVSLEKGNRRSVWRVNPAGYEGAHFAVYPPALIEPCVLAGSRRGDIVLDPFMGSGTTAAVALGLGRQYLGCELNTEYQALQAERIAAAGTARPIRKPRAKAPAIATSAAAAPPPQLEIFG